MQQDQKMGTQGTDVGATCKSPVHLISRFVKRMGRYMGLYVMSELGELGLCAAVSICKLTGTGAALGGGSPPHTRPLIGIPRGRHPGALGSAEQSHWLCENKYIVGVTRKLGARGLFASPQSPDSPCSAT